ncbi:MAG: hypothetical protein NTY46_12510, partial [Candidatus Sumerlaeota bacterium]|nr:hypothetical protein [Candidatus Sumerlaeota bacterium]
MFTSRSYCGCGLRMWVGLLLCAALGAIVTTGQAEPRQTAGKPVAEILKTDGSLDLTRGFSGSLDVRGFNMITDTVGGSPRFVPAGSGGGEGAGDPALMSPGIASGSDDDVYWDDRFVPPGTNFGTVNAAVADGAGNLYIGGTFTMAGGVTVNGITKWNGSSWLALGTGMNSQVNALAVIGSDLYAGGWFDMAGGVSAKYIAKWDGSSWSALGSGMDYVVSALAVNGSDLYVGGDFSTAGGVSASNVAKWNGSSWSALGSGMGGTDPYVRALAVSGSDLYVGGDFTSAGGVSASNVAKWNGSSWSALGSGMDDSVFALAVIG